MQKSLLVIALILLASTTWSVEAQQVSQYEKREFIHENDTLLYRILYPHNYDETKQYPVVLFLHGAGERGSDNERQLNLGGDLFLNEKLRKKYPAIVIFPQCPVDTMWTARTKNRDAQQNWVFNFPVSKVAPRPAEMVNLLVEEYMETPSVDKNRIYIMGISMGGIGTLEFLHRWPEKYAAAAVICGGHDFRITDNYKHLPIWFFHGEADDVVPHHYSYEVYKAVCKGNRRTRYTSYPNTNHNSWDKALAEPKLLKWMFNNQKEN
ncbi:prolyl oligopeptidase family serine peptidase [Sunxiuqinia elliptica]|uniref:Phospholipase/carboxylesterase n=1 Tax=Sunxiuqinia elliptica TaxID=655355 RepID=A0A4R6GSP4_9BACT|nr:prolyl oligopeptidase family serine peptidase [Sunxiuqinia elliptica]TDN98399.1 phospholipase/carboxylesterase [Sunxiuqinia elliptica]TDO60502.1 phospholipase/carboxylesterase [Sunxiuqinia elliptica]